MSTFRVLLDEPPVATRADAWALFDDSGRVLQSGRGAPDTWPGADRREAVLAASRVRIVALQLPPLPADRVAAAAAFALEDQLAGPANEQHIAVSTQRRDGTVEALVARRGLVAALATAFDRVLAEPGLAPCPDERHWCWYVSAAGGGFVRKPDGSAFATGDPQAPPSEMTLALDHAARAGGAPVDVAASFDIDEATRNNLAQRLRTTVVPAPAWRWDAAGGAAFADATDVLQGEFAPAAPMATRASTRWLRSAALVAAVAVALHVLATLGEWVVVRVDDWRTQSALASAARDAGISSDDDPATAIARRHADARHRAGLAAPTDAMPLLARAAPALAGLPAGVLKAALYADGQWTFDLTKSDDGVTARLAQQLHDAGLATLHATNASGMRMRVSLAPGAH